MKIKLQIPFIFRNFIFLLFFSVLSSGVQSQELYIGQDATFYLPNDVNFTTSNSVIEIAANGNFVVEAGSNWGSATEYVNGKVETFGSGLTVLPVGNNGKYAPVTMDHTLDASAIYFNTSPTSGANGVNVDAVSNVEHWKLTGNAIITLPWNESSDITSLVNNNGGSLNSIAIVGLNGGEWNLISDPQTSRVSGDLLNGEVSSDLSTPVILDDYGEFTFGIDHQIVLAVDDLFQSTGIGIISNPVLNGEENIRFSASGDVTGLKASIFDINGRLVKRFDNLKLFGTEGNLSRSGLNPGFYFIKFEHEGKQGVKKIIIE